MKNKKKTGDYEMGHRSHDQGCGTHDIRQKRNRTRQALRAKWEKDNG